MGVALLLVGIVALNRVRMEIPLEKENQTKLVKFMIRMGVFSVLYLVPLLTVIGCYLYEHTYRSIWETTWMEENCRRYHIPCPYKVERDRHNTHTHTKKGMRLCVRRCNVSMLAR